MSSPPEPPDDPLDRYSGQRLVPSYGAALRDRAVQVLALLLLIYYVATPGIFEGKVSGDGVINFLYLPSLVVYRTTDMKPARLASGSPWALPEVDGKEVNEKPLGPPLLMLPFYLVGLGIDGLARALGGGKAQLQPLGVNAIEYWTSGLATLLWGIIGSAACFLVLRRRLSLEASRFGTLVAVGGTPLVWYLCNQPGYQHGMAFAFVAILVERWDAWRRAPTRCGALLIGVAAGIAILIRAQEGAFLLLPAVDVLGGLWRGSRADPTTGGQDRREWFWQGLLVLAPALALASLQLAFWKLSLGSFRPPLASSSYLRFDHAEVVGLLFSMRAGLFTWSPIVYLAVFGLLVARRRLGSVAGLLLLVTLPQVYLDACPLDWWGAWGYGARRLTDLGILFAMGLGGAWAWAEGRSADRWPRIWPQVWLTFASFAVAFNLVTTEAMRQGRMPSTTWMAMGGHEWLQRWRAPAWLVTLARRTGNPFAWPASLPFALRHRVSPTTFEEVYGNYFVETAYVFQGPRPELNMSLDLRTPVTRRYLLEGFGPTHAKEGTPVTSGAGQPARLLIPIFTRTALRLHLTGKFPAGLRGALVWNGHRVPIENAVTPAEIPGPKVRFGVNEVLLELPPGSVLKILSFEKVSSPEPGRPRP